MGVSTTTAIPRRRFAVAIGLLLACIAARQSAGVAIEVVIDRATGELFLKNPTATVEAIDGYFLFSPGASLLDGNLTSISTTYDASGDQSVDATAEWFLIDSSDESITEVSTVALSGALDPGEFVSLGDLWNVGDLEALSVTLSAGVTTTSSLADFRDLGADYDGDLDVDLDDLAVYNSTFGSTTLLAADGNGDGVVDAADYAFWRESPELSLPTSTTLTTPALLETSGAPVTPVPEPSAALLLAATAASSGLRLRRR